MTYKMKDRYIPKRGEVFNAIVRGNGRIAHQCPCVCQKVCGEHIDATEKARPDNEREFKFNYFRFAKVVKSVNIEMPRRGKNNV